MTGLLFGGIFIFAGVLVIYCITILFPSNSAEKRKREKERRETRLKRQKLINDVKLDIARNKDETNCEINLKIKKLDKNETDFKAQNETKGNA